MRYIIVPADVEIENEITKVDGTTETRLQTQSFEDYIKKTLINHGDVLSNSSNLKFFREIVAEVKGLASGAEMILQEEQHELLARMAKGLNYGPAYKLAILPFVEAILAASKESSLVVRQTDSKETKAA